MYGITCAGVALENNGHHRKQTELVLTKHQFFPAPPNLPDTVAEQDGYVGESMQIPY
jgi:hypothetical protein